MGHYRKPRVAKTLRLKAKQEKRNALIEKENILGFLVETKKLDEQECTMLDAFKAQYVWLRSKGLGFTGKYYKKYIKFRDEILEKYKEHYTDQAVTSFVSEAVEQLNETQGV